MKKFLITLFIFIAIISSIGFFGFRYYMKLDPKSQQEFAKDALTIYERYAKKEPSEANFYGMKMPYRIGNFVFKSSENSATEDLSERATVYRHDTRDLPEYHLRVKAGTTKNITELQKETATLIIKNGLKIAKDGGVYTINGTFENEQRFTMLWFSSRNEIVTLDKIVRKDVTPTDWGPEGNVTGAITKVFTESIKTDDKVRQELLKIFPSTEAPVGFAH